MVNFRFKVTKTADIKRPGVGVASNVKSSFFGNQEDPASDNIFTKTFRYTPKRLRCYIYQCRGLPPADSDGNSDPFIVIASNKGDDVKTDVIENNLNPIFMCCKTVDFEVRDRNDLRNTCPPILLNLFDSDRKLLSNSADYLGRATIMLKNASYNENRFSSPPVPKWHPIKFGVKKTSAPCGEILCSFCIYDPSKHEDEEEEGKKVQ